MSYTMDRTVAGNFDEIVDRTTDSLSEEGFGILCDVDVQQTFEEKLDQDYSRYRILGACNPKLAEMALDSERQLGALLPCNVIVYETDGADVGVSAVDPEVMLSLADNPELEAIATEVRQRFERVLNDLSEA